MNRIKSPEYEVQDLVRMAFETLGVPAPICSVRALRASAGEVFAIDLRLEDASTQLGWYYPFSVGQRDGYWTNFVYGYVRGGYRARTGDDIRLVMDWTSVTETPDWSSPYRVISRTQALAEGYLVPESEAETTLQRYQVDLLLVGRSHIVGPSVGMLKAADAMGRLAGRHTAGAVFDMFSGSGALAQVAFRSGAQRVVLVDKYVDRSDTDGLALTYVSADCLDVWSLRGALTNGGFGALVDPFEIDALRVCALSGVLLEHLTLAVVNLGDSERRGWVRSCLDAAMSAAPAGSTTRGIQLGHAILMIIARPRAQALADEFCALLQSDGPSGNVFSSEGS